MMKNRCFRVQRRDAAMRSTRRLCGLVVMRARAASWRGGIGDNWRAIATASRLSSRLACHLIRRHSCPTAPSSSSPTAPASPPKPSATRSWRSSRSSRATCAGPSSTRVDKAHQVVRRDQPHGRGRGQAADRLHHAGQRRDPARSSRSGCKGMVLDMFSTFVEPLEAEFGIKSQPPRRPLLRRRARARSTTTASRRSTSRWPTTTASRRKNLEAGRRDPGRRQPQRQDADLALPGDAARHQGGQLPADPGRLRARQAARRRWRRTRPSASA